MKRLKRKYIEHLTPGLTFKDDFGYQHIYCVVNNKKVLYNYYSGDETIFLWSQNYDWNENYYKLVLVDKELLKKFKL